MEYIKELLDAKGGAIWSVTPDNVVIDALRLMAEKNVGAVVVLNQAGEMEGIFSERDYARKIVLVGKTSQNTKVADVMTKRVFYMEPGEKITQCMALMTKERIRHVPVLDNGKLIGIVSIGDVVKSIITKQEQLIEQLEHYIMGRA